MKAISKALLSERDQIVSQLTTRHEALTAAVEAFNDALEQQWEAVDAAQDAYNETVQEANQWLVEVSDAIEAYMQERSEKWLDGPKGAAYAAWQREYQYNELEESTLEMPGLVDVNVDSQVDTLEGRSEDVEA